MVKQKKVAIYTRVSTVEQAEEGYSIDEQERLLREFCKKNDFDVYKCYADRGISGKNITARPALQALLLDAQNSCFDLVLVWKINRFARNVVDILEMVENLSKLSITFKSLTEPFENETPTGKLSLTMMAAVGEFERSTIAQNVKMGMMARAKAGKWNGGLVLGYDLIDAIDQTSHRKRERQLVINKDEAKAVELIFDLYSKGSGYKSIVSKINMMGCRTKKGNMFSVASIREILLNPVYIGMIRYNVRQNWNEKRRRNINPQPIIEQGEHEPIISLVVWEKVQVLLSSTKGKPPRIHDGEYPLTGILKCPVCNAGMVISRTTNTLKDGTKKRITYYACGLWKNKGSAACKSNSVRVDKANKIVFDNLSKLFSNDVLIKEIVDTINKKRANTIKPDQDLLDKNAKELVRIAERKKKVFDAYENDIIDVLDFKKRMDELNKEETILSDHLLDLKRVTNVENTQVDVELVKSLLGSFETLLSSCNNREQKKRLLHLIISQIRLNEKREIESICIVLNDSLVKMLVNEGVSVDAPFLFASKRLGYEYFDIRFDLHV